MKLKLAERDATLYYDRIDYEAYEDVVRSKKDRTPVTLPEESRKLARTET